MDKIILSLIKEEILGLTLIGEARGEPIEGIVAVGSIIRNRVASSRTKTYSDICLEPEQFSCWNMNDVNYPMLLELAQKLMNGQYLIDAHYRQCMCVAKGIISYELLDNTYGCEYYMTKRLFNSSLRPKWARVPKKQPLELGSQVFFNV